MRRHAGVLGLSALVEACPYSVPSWLPGVLDEFALHLHDPARIAVGHPPHVFLVFRCNSRFAASAFILTLHF